MSYLSTIVQAIQVANQEILDEAEVNLLIEDLRLVKLAEGQEGKNTTITLSAHGPQLHGTQDYFYNRNELASILVHDTLEFYETPTIEVILFELQSKVSDGTAVPTIEDILSFTVDKETSTITINASPLSLQFIGSLTVDALFDYEDDTAKLSDLVGSGQLDGFEYGLD